MAERALRGCLAALVLALLHVAQPWPDARAAEPGDPARRDADTPVAYAPTIEGLTAHERRLEDVMRQSGIAFRLVDTPPETVDALRRRARQDVERFQQIMNSFGFYDGKVDFEVAAAPTADAPRPLVFTVETGAVYLLGEVMVQRGTDAEAEPASDDLLDALDLHIGMPAEAQAIIDAESALVTRLENDGRPFAQARDRQTVVHPDDKTLVVTYRLAPGPEARFGEVRIEGLETVDESHLRAYLLWEPDARFDRRKLDESRDELVATDLFQSVDIRPVQPVGDDGRVPVSITVRERPHRSIGFGVNYATNIGPGAEAFWEHRNFFNQGERVRASIAASSIEQGVEAIIRKPLFLDRDQALIADGELTNRDTDAFDEQRGAAFVGLEREIGENWFISAGPTLEYSQVTESAKGSENFLLAGLRAGARHETVDDLLDPTDGTKLEFAATPYTSLDDKALRFVKATLGGSAYYAVDDDDRFVLAGRARVGSIVGGDRDELPAAMRFYAGGGGSIRGYKYQGVGPIGDTGEPVGGKNLFEVGAELRARVTENVGIVPFIDGGNVFRDQLPEDADLLWAAGVGVRYYTAVGPLRADIAFPLDRRDTDDAFQFYFSLGQAF